MNKVYYILFLTFLNPIIVLICFGLVGNFAVDIVSMGIYILLWFAVRKGNPELDKQCVKIITGRY
jgi:hypothetical protein